MPPSSAILFLIVSHLFSSSASFLKAVKVSEELSPSTSMTASTIGPPVTSLNTSLTPLAALSGIVTFSKYSDSLCKNIIYTVVSGLNNCVRVGVSKYQYIIATSSAVLYSYYSDPYCLLLVESSTFANTNSACVDGLKSFVSWSMTYTAYSATAVIRWMIVWTIMKSHYTRRCSNPRCAIDIPSTYKLSDSICSGYIDEVEYIPDTTCLPFESSSVQYTLSGIHMHDYTQSSLFAKSIMNWILQVFDNSVGYIIHLRPSSMCKRISDMISSL